MEGIVMQGTTTPERGDVSSTELVPVEKISDALILQREPDAVLAEAVKAAKTLMQVMNSKKEKVVFNGERYLEAEDWQTVGHFYGVTAKNIGEPEFVNFGGIVGFKATCGLFTRDLREVGRATAYCLTDEEKWSARPKYAKQVQLKDGTWAEDQASDRNEWKWETRDEWKNAKNPRGSRPVTRRELVGEEAVPLYQLASMAQTRANSKVHSSVLRFVPVLAGFKATPAEEMPQAEWIPQEASQPEPDKSGVVRALRSVNDADLQGLPDGAVFLTALDPAHAPMRCKVQTHKGEEFLIATQPLEAQATNAILQLYSVILEDEALPTGGRKMTKIKRTQKPMTAGDIPL